MNEGIRLIPDFILASGATLVLILGALTQSAPMRDFLRWFSLLIVAITAAILSLTGSTDAPASAGGWLLSAPLNVTFGLVFLAILAWTLLSSTLPRADAGEWYSLLLFTGSGMLILSRAGNLGALFFGVEILSLALYVLIAFSYSHRLSLRAGAMYLVLAGFASGFLVFGLALIYAVYGTIDIPMLRDAIIARGLTPLSLIGFGLFLVGVAFKLSAVPFHMWAAEVYEAAPGPVAGLIASASKGAILAAFIPFLFLAQTHEPVLYFLAAASMIGGNLLGLREVRVKRILAYSSIAHIGYILVGYLAGRQVVPLVWDAAANGAIGQYLTTVDGISAIVFYIVTYALAIMGAFTALSLLGRENELTLRDLRPVAAQNPVIAACLLVFVISLAGLPMTAGFWGKMYLFSAGVHAGYIWLPLIGLTGTAIGIFYYIRIVSNLYFMGSAPSPAAVHATPLQQRILVLTAVAVVFFGILPEYVFHLLRLV